MDFSDYQNGDLIPPGTIAVLQMGLKYGEGTDNVLTPSKDRSCEYLSAAFTVLEGQYAKRKFFGNLVVVGTTDGQKSIAEKHLSTLKRILDSAFFLDPKDMSPEARAKRTIQWRDLDGLRFVAEIGVEDGKDGYDAKNIVAKAVTRDMVQWGNRAPLDQVAPTATPAAPRAATPSTPSTPPIPRPHWAP
jgi:hypothetical protein